MYFTLKSIVYTTDYNRFNINDRYNIYTFNIVLILNTFNIVLILNILITNKISIIN